MGEVAEAQRPVIVAGVPGRQHPAAQALQLGMGEDGRDQPAAQAAAAIGFENIDVDEIGESGAIGDDAGEPDLPRALIEAEGEGPGKRTGDHVAADAPIDVVKRFASTGYVRSNLIVLHGAANAGRAGGSPPIENGAPVSPREVVGGAGGGALAVEAALVEAVDNRLDQIREARLKGFEGDACGECGNFTLVRNGTCMKCATCGSTSGCS